MELRIYKNGREIEKVYQADGYRLTFGVVEDLVSLIGSIDWAGSTDDTAGILEILKVLPRGIESIKPIVMDVYDGITEEELKRADVGDLIQTFVEVFRYSIGSLQKLGGDRKNG